MSPTSQREVLVLPDSAAIAKRAADVFVQCVNQAIAEEKFFHRGTGWRLNSQGDVFAVE